jgi:autotransporter-associated beta strand protein
VRWPVLAISRILSALLLTGACVGPALAQDALWTGTTSGNWNTISNWSTGTVPLGTANFDNTGATKTITFSSSSTSIGTMQFGSAASDYTFTVFSAAGQTVSLNGLGIVSSSGNPVINVNSGFTAVNLRFTNSSGAGNAILNHSGFAGEIQFSNSSSAQNATITNNFANLSFRDSSTAGNARIFNNDSGTTTGTTFFDTSTAANATILNSGGALTVFRNASTAANATIGNENCGETRFFNSSSASNSHINIGSCGGVTFRDGSTAANAVITNKFAVSFGDTSTAGNAAITTSNGGLTVFSGSSSAGSATLVTLDIGRVAFIERSNGGQARFITEGSAVVDFSASKGPNNDGKLTAGSIEGSGSYFLGANQLGVGGNNLSTTVSGAVSDCGPTGHDCAGSITSSFALGSLLKVGTGTLTLAGINTYTGTTDVNAGTLSVNGSIASSSLTTVNAGGTLGGNGVVGNTTINGGRLAPGNSIGLLTVHGNLLFTAAASYMVEISPANADRTNVTGAATLGGATVNASFAAGTYVNKQYTILNAGGGVTGAFNGPVNSNLPNGFKSSLSYDANNAYLNLEIVLAQYSGLNGNQQNVANALANFFNTTDGIPLVFGTLTPAGLTQVSGETATASQQTTFDAMNLFMGVLTDPFIAGRGDPAAPSGPAPQFAEQNDAARAYAANGSARATREREAYAAVYRKAPAMADPYLPRWSVWTAGYGGSQTTDGNAASGSNNTRSSIGGVAVGADYRFSPTTIAGFALAGGATNFSVNGLGSGRSDLFQAGAFVRHSVGAAYITGALAYGWQDITTDRTVTIAGTDLLRARFDANAFSGRVEGGFRFVTPWMAMGVTPYVAGQFTRFDLPAYAEQAIAGANTFALTYAAKNVTAPRNELGLRADKFWSMQDGIFTLRGRAAWAHDYNTGRAIGATFQTLPGASFVVNGAAQAHDAALVTASAEMKWLSGFAAAATFEGEFSSVTTSYAGKGVVRYTW